MKQIKIDYVKKLHPVLTKPKRIKIVIGGRGSTKSTGIADMAAVGIMNGELWCGAREHQNSIEESVHRTIMDEISRLGLEGFEDTKTSIIHSSGGRIFYRGLSRNITALKSMLSGVDKLWIEEGEGITDSTLAVLTASVRLNAKDTERKIAGEDVKFPEIIITMNRGSRTGAIDKKWLARAEKSLNKCGYYEDDMLMVVEMNYTDMPKEWFKESGLEEERLDDKEKMSAAQYNHKWNGKYLDEAENAIIKTEWFEAAIDAHKIPHLENIFKPHGAVLASFDPSDEGRDPAALVIRHASIIKVVKEKTVGEIDDKCDWATGEATKAGADWFLWDGDGMGAGLKGQVKKNFKDTKTRLHMFRGSLSGSGQDNADDIYIDINDSRQDKIDKKYSETFLNNRAQYYTALSTLFYNTYRCVVKGEYVDPLEMISIDSDGVEDMNGFRSEVCKVPLKSNGRGLIQIMSKEEMFRLGIKSPNMADGTMQSLFKPPLEIEPIKINFKGWNG